MLLKTENAGLLVKTTLVDFPGRVASAFFLPGCNLRCPYCFNIPLVNKTLQENQSVSLEELYSHLKKRKNVLSGLVISGGEPLLNENLNEIIITAKSLGYKIKLDTNGTLPEKLFSLIEQKETCPDYIALDVKTSPQKYGKLLSISKKDSSELEQKILTSINILKDFPKEKREFRTPLVPYIIEENDIKKISTILPKDAKWYFASFLNKNCLNPSFNSILPFSKEEEEKLLAIAKKNIPDSHLR